MKRHRVPKNDLFKGADREYWHWTDLNIGAEIALYGRKAMNYCTIVLKRKPIFSRSS